MTPPSSAPDAPPSDIEASLATWLNASPHGIVVVRFDRTILWSNAAARTLEGVNLTDGVLSLFDFWSTEALADFVADLTDRPSAWCRILPSGEPLIVRGERILLGGPPILALTFRLARDHGRTVAWPDLTVALGLSRGQAAVALQLVEGHDVERIAERSGISTHTVRTHIQRMYRTLGVSNREALIARLLQYRTT